MSGSYSEIQLLKNNLGSSKTSPELPAALYDSTQNNELKWLTTGTASNHNGVGAVPLVGQQVTIPSSATVRIRFRVLGQREGAPSGGRRECWSGIVECIAMTNGGGVVLFSNILTSSIMSYVPNSGNVFTYTVISPTNNVVQVQATNTVNVQMVYWVSTVEVKILRTGL